MKKGNMFYYISVPITFPTLYFLLSINYNIVYTRIYNKSINNIEYKHYDVNKPKQ
jgi:hypothetical protein